MKIFLFGFLWLLANPFLFAQQFDLPAAAAENEAALAKVMPRLARQAIAAYKDSDQDRYLFNLFQLQLTAGQYSEADATIRSLRGLRKAANSLGSLARLFPFDVYAQARVREAASKLVFADALEQSFREWSSALDDKSANQLFYNISPTPYWPHNNLAAAMAKQKGKSGIALADAVDLINAYQTDQVFKTIAPLTDALIAEDDARRYIIDDKVLIKTPDNASVAAIVVRPRAAVPMPAGRCPQHQQRT
jgi:uncharacterized protein